MGIKLRWSKRRTRGGGARSKSRRDNGVGVIIGAGLSGAVANTVAVVGLAAQAGQVAAGAAKLRSLSAHVAETHLLKTRSGQ